MMNETLKALLQAAVQDEALRRRLLATEQAADPLVALCQEAVAAGYPLTLSELVFEGETYADEMLKSTNGGATYPFDYLNDAVAIFYAALR